MPRTDGQYFAATIKALKLDADQEKDAKSNAESIVDKVIDAYERNIAVGHVGAEAKGIPTGFLASAHAHALTGLVYGRIQSGKTRAMIASTAMAFDNGFRIVVVLTSNINDLVTQTHFDFASGLPNVMVYTKDDELDGEISNAKLHLKAGDARMLIVCSKGAPSLTNVIAFLKKVDAKLYPSIIFDDEGDQASLDTNTQKRSLSLVAVAPSSINKLIQEKLRPLMPSHIYVSVTGTPQAVLLQSAESKNRPSFITLLPPGESYIGGKYFFGSDEPEDNPHHLIRTVELDEKQKLLAPNTPIPKGLRRAILFFLLSAAALIKKNGRSDAMHRASKLSRLNKRRIRATPKDGGSATSWTRGLLPKCYLKKKGQSYRSSVYGRMRWDEPAPTMTTHCHTLGTGRFGHPAQNRAISLREAARFQTFPDYYQFHEPGKLNVSTVAQHIGNAVPVRLGQVIAVSIKRHVAEFRQDKRKL